MDSPQTLQILHADATPMQISIFVDVFAGQVPARVVLEF
jgi:hypothetical protein